MASENIINVSESDFEYQVLAYSEQVPVVVDFWAEWCVPCKTLGPVLERLADEAQGSFRLAKVDVDQNPNLAMQYAIHSIPAVKAFRNGKVVSEFTGAQPEPKLRQFIRAIAPSPADLHLEKGNSLLQLQKWSEAELAFEHALEINPDSSAGLLGLAKSLLAQGYPIEALDILRNFPPSREYTSAEALLPLANALERVQNGDYFSDELGIVYKLSVEDDRLLLGYKGSPRQTLQPLTSDSFKAARSTLQFTRDKQNQIIGFLLGVGRVKNLQFFKCDTAS